MSTAQRDEQNARDEVKHQDAIREIQDSGPTRLQQELSRSDHQHLRNMKMLADEADRFKKEVDQRILKEQAEHEQKKEESIRNAQIEVEQNSKKIDVLTSIALNHFEDATSKFNEKNLHLDKEIAEGKARSMIMESEVGRQIFDEVDNKKDMEELLAQKKTEVLMDKRNEIHEAQREAASSEREERKENQVMAINDIRSDLVDVQSMGMQDLAIQRCVDDQKNRRQVNGKMAELKNGPMADFDGFFGRAAVVLGATEDHFARLSERQIRSTKQYVTRLSECLRAINDKVGAIEQNLAFLELEDVSMSDELRKIKSKVSDFQPVIAGLRRNLELKIAIEEENNKRFSDLKDDLFNIINNLQPIAENRRVITESIQQRHNVSMPIEAISDVSQKLEIKN